MRTTPAILKTRKPQAAFSLIELMIVTAIIGVLALVAVPKFSQLIRKSQEAAVRGQLGALRSAITIYHAENEGLFPAPNLFASLIPKYIGDAPRIALPTYDHRRGKDCLNIGLGFMFDWPVPVSGPAPWGYFDSIQLPGSERILGDVIVMCTDTDMNGRMWSTY
jgi:prepilin-type N-terminal cleavage/methylation domain-containing protein